MDSTYKNIYLEQIFNFIKNIFNEVKIGFIEVKDEISKDINTIKNKHKSNDNGITDNFADELENYFTSLKENVQKNSSTTNIIDADEVLANNIMQHVKEELINDLNPYIQIISEDITKKIICELNKQNSQILEREDKCIQTDNSSENIENYKFHEPNNSSEPNISSDTLHNSSEPNNSSDTLHKNVLNEENLLIEKENILEETNDKKTTINEFEIIEQNSSNFHSDEKLEENTWENDNFSDFSDKSN